MDKWENGYNFSCGMSALKLRVGMCAAKLKYSYNFNNGDAFYNNEEVYFETFEEAKAAGIERFKKELNDVIKELN